MNDSSPVPDAALRERAVDVALAEFAALRAEILAYSTSQNTFVGLGFTAIGVLGGIAIPRPEQRGLLIVVPLLCAVLILVYTGLAYRIVVAGNYIEHVLWPHLTGLVGAGLPPWEPGRPPRRSQLPSWESGLAGLESRGAHRRVAQVVEYLLVGLLTLFGVAAAVTAAGITWWLRGPFLGVLALATACGLWLGWRRRLSEADFRWPDVSGAG